MQELKLWTDGGNPRTTTYQVLSLNNKDWFQGGLNQNLIRDMRAFVWRYHLSVDADLKGELGKLK